MKTIVSLLFLASLALCGVESLRATEPAKPPRQGKVLLLKNERLLEGDIERIGDRYRIRGPIGEAWIPTDLALCLTASRADAFAYLRERANPEDADERLRLARWCMLNGLPQQAAAEAQAADQLRPNHDATQRLLRHLRQTTVNADKPKPKPAAVNKTEDEPSPPIELTTESLSTFATRVQPILMNTCANCHANGRGTGFRLRHAYGVGLADRKTVEQNLAAVLAQIDVRQPEFSRLLTKAVSDHAHKGQAPIRDRKDAPYRTLEEWVKRTLADNPQLRAAAPAASTAGQTPEPHPAATAWGVDSHPAAGIAVPPLPVAEAKKETTPKPSSPGAAGTEDPYDPEPFNRQLHPETNKPGPQK